MSAMSMDDGYETSAPQWTDFSEITPNRNVEGDEYFDRIHDNLETLSNYNPEKRRRNQLRENVNAKMAEVSTIFVDTPNNTDADVSEIESTFINDIDKIRITPIKVTSPRTKKKESIVTQELSVNQVLTNAIKGLEIASSKSRTCHKLQILNSTVCPSSTNNAKLTSSQRKVRISRSMQFQSEYSSNGKTPAAKAAAIPRNIVVPKVIISIDAPESGASSTNIVKSNEISAEIANKCENNHRNVSSVCGNSPTKFKIPTKLSRSIHAGPSTPKSTIKKETSIIKTPKLKMPIKKPATDVNKIDVDNSICSDLKKTEIDIVDIAAIQYNEKPASNHEELNVPTAKSISNESFNDEKMENIGINVNVHQPDINNFAAEKDFQSHEEFAKKLHYDDACDGDFVVHQSNHVEHRNYHSGKPTLVTNPARRRSSIANRRRRSNKYISLAEAVSTFHRSTPTRFHTVSSKPGPVQRIKVQATTKCTIPVSPALQSKTRVRQHAILSQAEREEMEIKNMRKHQVHANPIRPEILTRPEPLKPVARKPITVPKPFKLSGKPKSTKLPPPPPITSTASSAPLSVLPLQPPPSHPQIARAKRVMALAPSEDSQSLENREIINFGIPLMDSNVTRHDSKKKTTRLQPFSLEERHKQFLSKKEEKLKLLQSEQAKKMKFEFHARPAPAAVKKNSATEIAKDKLLKPSTMSHVQIVPFSFEGRDKMVAKKKEELRKKIEEQERKARVFHANPAPAIKPVAVRSTSRENLKIVTKTKSSENLKTEGKTNYNFGNMTRSKSTECLKSGMRINGRNQLVENQKTTSQSHSNDNIKNKLNDLKSRKNSSEQVNDQENITPNIPVSKAINPLNMPTLKPTLKPLPVELHSDKRARLRREYDEKVRMKLEQDEERRKREQEEKLAREHAEIAEIRKKAKVKARPMPVYKPLVVAKSNRPLTEAESPAWTKTKR